MDLRTVRQTHRLRWWSSATCSVPHCKEAQPTLDKLMAEDKNVRVVFQSFPLPMHDWAAKAAAYADCVSRSSNDAFWKFITECLRSAKRYHRRQCRRKIDRISRRRRGEGR